MDSSLDILAGVLIGIVIVVVIIMHKRSIGKFALDKAYFKKRWTKVQKLCVDRKLWYKAVIQADELLDEALRQRHYKGKTPGERLVSAQHQFTSNDSLWLSHKLKNKIKEDNLKKLSKQQTLEALAAFRLALIDIGALEKEDKKGKTNAK
ncbi:MAG: hypothetical protein ACYCPS_00270 [Candidatus Saccharimonadales bacterium]